MGTGRVLRIKKRRKTKPGMVGSERGGKGRIERQEQRRERDRDRDMYREGETDGRAEGEDRT